MMEKTPEESDNKIEPAVAGGETGSMEEPNMKILFTQDEYQLAKLGYKQEFFRGLGLFENWYVQSSLSSPPSTPRLPLSGADTVYLIRAATFTVGVSLRTAE